VVLVACSAPVKAPITSRVDRSPPPAVPVDRDGDGIPDDRDRCPTQPEDYDGFEDADGCPDPDNDGDGVPDADDDCPYEAGPNRGCVKPCKVFVHSIDDCFIDPSVFYDADSVPQAERIDDIVKIVKANPTVHALEVLGPRADLVSVPLRARLPGIAITDDRRDIPTANAVYVRITKQQFDDGRFRAMECTPFGAIYHVARAENCTR
jgi:hypothetical protein